MIRNSLSLLVILTVALALRAEAQIADKVVRTKIAGIDLIAYKTGVENVVTFRGSLPAGDCFAPKDNLAIPTLVGEMLDKGTTQHDKFAIAQKLDEIGAKIDFSVGGVMEYFVEGGHDNDAYVIGGGAAYSMDPFVFGIQGSHGHYDGTDAFSLTANPGGSRKLNRIIATMDYAMAPGINLDAEIGYTWFKDTGDGVPDAEDDYNAFNIAIGSVFMF